MTQIDFEPVEKVSVRDRVKRAIHAAIVSGQMEPGRVYSAPTLGARLGVSATPVREAMIDLVRDGLVEMVPNKGFRVTEVSERDLDEIIALRLLIEPPVTAQVTPVVPDADFDQLTALAEAIVTHARSGDVVEYTEADRVFHLRLLAYADNSRISNLVSDLRGNTRLFGISALHESGELVDVAREHLAIVAAMRRRDAAEAEQLMLAHISQARGRWARP